MHDPTVPSKPIIFPIRKSDDGPQVQIGPEAFMPQHAFVREMETFCEAYGHRLETLSNAYLLFGLQHPPTVPKGATCFVAYVHIADMGITMQPERIEGWRAELGYYQATPDSPPILTEVSLCRSGESISGVAPLPPIEYYPEMPPPPQATLSSLGVRKESGQTWVSDLTLTLYDPAGNEPPRVYDRLSYTESLTPPAHLLPEQPTGSELRAIPSGEICSLPATEDDPPTVMLPDIPDAELSDFALRLGIRHFAPVPDIVAYLSVFLEESPDLAASFLREDLRQEYTVGRLPEAAPLSEPPAWEQALRTPCPGERIEDRAAWVQHIAHLYESGRVTLPPPPDPPIW